MSRRYEANTGAFLIICLGASTGALLGNWVAGVAIAEAVVILATVLAVRR